MIEITCPDCGETLTLQLDILPDPNRRMGVEIAGQVPEHECRKDAT